MKQETPPARLPTTCQPAVLKVARVPRQRRASSGRGRKSWCAAAGGLISLFLMETPGQMCICSPLNQRKRSTPFHIRTRTLRGSLNRKSWNVCMVNTLNIKPRMSGGNHTRQPYGTVLVRLDVLILCVQLASLDISATKLGDFLHLWCTTYDVVA